MNLAKKFNVRGSLIFNFRLNPENEIVFTTFFIEYLDDFNLNSGIYHRMNSFYKYNLLQKKKPDISNFANFLWRFENSSKKFILDDFSELFNNGDKYNLQDELKFNSQFEDNLLKHNIDYIRINKNILFIEQTILFYSSYSLNHELVLKILK
ncbi:MAG: hypothetical protein ACFFAO_11645, partial [Candidatus Hermodarchaeota archaeon]